MIEILPSLLAADFARLGEQIAQVTEAGVNFLHFDVMDGHFVPNISFGVPVLQSLRKSTKLAIDVHLMIEDADTYAPMFVAAGADCVSVHQEACPHLDRTIRMIQSEGARAGVVLNPATPLVTVENVLPLVDYILLMSVNPGFGGQSFIPYVLEKVRALREQRERLGLSFSIEIDGGVSVDNVGRVAEAGVDWVVAGSSVFGAPNPAHAVTAMRQAAMDAVARRV
ncbi:ribulose-phosphate 3-epimerase [Paludibaculum fermentans]|uniref:Ribulose-phosphate 3-epimerase n=1 Tax=Paludibaculum fermentans TaxID=1473598 RepID=A0A7S7NXL0_PALFE|nr:ribulose-phosphate 3-epimerase [Paludibaculum fermentans]QOY91652.1 ribulose-phosphate 3-epimerase [Paludibaculum fermentans]